MESFVLTLHVILCVLLVFIILMQPGKGGDVSAAFGGGSSTQLFGAAGPGNFLTRGTGVIAFLFVVTSVTLAKMSGGVGSDVDEAFEAQEADAPSTPAADTPAGTTPAAPTAPEPAAPAAPAPAAPAPAAPAEPAPSAP
jgi:preprotein translocase subunit SecG